MSEQTARIGIVGLGGQGRGHADRVTALGHELVAGTDVVADAREAFTEEYGVPTYEDAAEMYDGEDLDGVVITTPNKFHEASAVPALKRDVNVLCEKPLAHTLESAENIAEAARDSAGFCMLGFHSRYGNAAKVLKSDIEDGEYGEVRHVEANYMRRRGVPGIGGWFTTKELSGGGALIDIGVHVLDLALHFLDFPEVVEVSGVTRADFGDKEDYAYLDMWGEPTEERNFDVDDSATALLRFADDSTVVLNVAWAANCEPEASLQVLGTESGADLQVHGGEITTYETEADDPDHHVTSELEVPDNEAHREEVAAFAAGAAEGESPEWNTVEQGLTVQRVIDAIYRSSESGRAVQLD